MSGSHRRRLSIAIVRSVFCVCTFCLKPNETRAPPPILHFTPRRRRRRRRRDGVRNVDYVLAVVLA